GFGVAHAIARSGWPRVIAWAVTMTAGELLRGYILTGFPWAMLGYVWSEGPGAQLVAPLGSYGLTLLTLLGVAGAVLLWQRWRLAGAAAVLGLWGAGLGAGALLLAPETG